MIFHKLVYQRASWTKIAGISPTSLGISSLCCFRQLPASTPGIVVSFHCLVENIIFPESIYTPYIGSYNARTNSSSINRVQQRSSSHCSYMEVSSNGGTSGTPLDGYMENPTETDDDWGYLYVRKPPYVRNFLSRCSHLVRSRWKAPSHLAWRIVTDAVRGRDDFCGFFGISYGPSGND